MLGQLATGLHDACEPMWKYPHGGQLKPRVVSSGESEHGSPKHHNGGVFPINSFANGRVFDRRITMKERASIDERARQKAKQQIEPDKRSSKRNGSVRIAVWPKFKFRGLIQISVVANMAFSIHRIWSEDQRA